VYYRIIFIKEKLNIFLIPLFIILWFNS